MTLTFESQTPTPVPLHSLSKGSKIDFKVHRDVLLNALHSVSSAQSACESGWTEIKLAANGLVYVSSLAKTFSIQCSFPSDHSSEGSFKFAGKPVLEYLKQLPPIQILMSADLPEKLTVRCGRSSARFQLVFDSLPTDFEIPEVGTNIMIKAQELKDWCFSYLDFISVDDSRFFSNGALISLENNSEGIVEFSAVASDSIRLAKSSLKKNFEIKEKDASSVLVPKIGIEEIHRLASSLDPQAFISLRWQQESIFFAAETDSYKMFIKGISGKYPNYMAAVPKKIEITKKISRQELLESVKRVLLFCDKSRHISLIFDGDTLEIASFNHLGGPKAGQEFLKLNEDHGKSFAVEYNGQNLVSVLTRFSDEFVIFSWENAAKPVKISRTENEFIESFYLLVPIRNS